MSATKKTGKSQVPFIITIIISIVCIAAFFVCNHLVRSYTSLSQAELQQQQEAAMATNEAIYLEYQQAVADYDAEVVARNGANEAWPVPAGEGWEIVDLTNYPLESAYYETMTRQETMYNGMLLVNEWHSRPDDFSELSLVSVSAYSGHAVGVKDNTIKLFPDAAQAVWDMVTAAKALGYENYVLYDAYRSWDEQNTLFQTELEAIRRKHPSYNDTRLLTEAKKIVNYPGTSSYNGGLTFRIKLYKRGDETVNNKEFFGCDEGMWFYEHAWEYGIVFRFQLADYPVKGTTDKGYKTGVSTKLQTFSYVGKGNAAVMNTLDLCVEEYIEYLGEHPHIAVYENGVLRYEIVRQYVGEEEAFQVQLVGTGRVKNHTTSLDNMGYVITVFEY